MQLEILTRPGPQSDSPTILLAHGAWHSAECWKAKFFAAFDGYTLVAPSLRGHGASKGREQLKDWRLRDYVEDIASVAANLRASSGVDPIVVGHSMGAFVVLKYLEQHPAPAGILLSCPPPHGAFLAAMQFALAHPRPFAETSIGYLRHMRQGIPPLMPTGLFSPELPSAERDEYISRLQPESARVYSDVFLLDMPQPNRIKTPLLFLKGKADPFLTTAHLTTNGRVFSADHRLLEGGHDLMLDTNAQQVATVMADWLKARSV